MSDELTRGVLAGRRIAVTRARGENSRVSTLLREQGAQVLEVPLIRFARTHALEALQAELSNLRANWLLLTSNQAVTALFAELNALGLDARALHRVKLAAVGSSTAQTLQSYGLWADFVPSQAGAKYLAAELPAHSGQRVLHLTSQLSEAALSQGLQRRGMALERLELYRTEPADLSADERQLLEQAHAVTLASGSAARHLAALGLTHLPVAVMGPQTAQAAKEAGFDKVIEAQHISLEGLVKAVGEMV